MIDVRGLGYLIVEATDVAAWRTFGTDVVGLGVAPFSTDDAVYLKTDGWPFRLAAIAGAADRLDCSGWELANDASFESAVAEHRFRCLLALPFLDPDPATRLPSQGAAHALLACRTWAELALGENRLPDSLALRTALLELARLALAR